jgi:hypothetical protein
LPQVPRPAQGARSGSALALARIASSKDSPARPGKRVIVDADAALFSAEFPAAMFALDPGNFLCHNFNLESAVVSLICSVAEALFHAC